MDGALFNAAVARRHLRRERVFRDRQDPLATLRDSEIRERYRFSRQNIVRIAGIIREDIEHPTRRNHALPALFQLLLAIRFFTCGTYQRVIGDASIYVSISTVCRCIRAVSLALSRRMNAFIRFPVGDQVVETKRQLRNIAGFPNVIGLIDCTHVRIIAPHENEADFVNRKGYHSLNVQAVCIANSYITDIVARWPGSCHDSRIFRESRLCEKFERREVDGLLLGDSGYALKPYLMTPFIAPLADAQRRYNSAHQRTRVRIEQTFGILKKRFGCLHGEIRMAPDRTCCVIVACVCLHNFAITQHDVYEDGVDGIDHQADVEMEPAGAHHQPDADGQIVRNVMVNYFN